MLELCQNHFEVITVIVITVTVILMVICLVKKLFRLAIGLALLYIAVPIVFTVVWGDGKAYVSKFASMFQPAYQQQIEDAYRFFKDKDSEDSFIDYEAVSSAVTDVFQQIIDQHPH